MSRLRRWKSRLTRAVAAILLAVLLVAAPVAHASATRAEYAVEADPICRSADKDINHLWKRFRREAKQYPFKIQAAANALESIGRRYSSAVRSLSLIGPPVGDEGLISQWLELHSRSAAKYPLAASAYRLNEYKRLNRLIDSADRLARRASSLMSDWPFQRCA